MSQFNKANTVNKGLSANGNLQDVKTAEQQFYDLAVNTLFGKDSFYESNDERAKRFGEITKKLVSQGKFDFIANMLLFARTEMNIRNMPIFGTVEFADALRNAGKHYPKLRNLVADVTRRADQINDVLALTLGKLGGKNKMPMAIKRGLSDAFNKFDEYGFAKYNREGNITFKKALRIVHPTPVSGAKSDLFDKIMKGTLQTPDTWEVALSTEGQKSVEDRRSKKEIWEDLIDRKTLGYQATLKNLRNMMEAGISNTHITKVANSLVERVENSKALPFEFFRAYEAIASFNNQVLKRAISDCMDASVKNVPKLGNKVWVIVDTSGSMRGLAEDTACFFASVIAKAHEDCDNFALTMFASDAKTIDLVLDNSVMGNYQFLKRHGGGGSTNFQAALAQESKLGFKPDAVFVLTDNEINSFGGYAYHGNSDTAVMKTAPGAMKFVINMAASTTTPLPERLGWHMLSGWSEKLFNYIDALKKGNSIVNMLSVPYPYKVD